MRFLYWGRSFISLDYYIYTSSHTASFREVLISTSHFARVSRMTSLQISHLKVCIYRLSDAYYMSVRITLLDLTSWILFVAGYCYDAPYCTIFASPLLLHFVRPSTLISIAFSHIICFIPVAERPSCKLISYNCQAYNIYQQNARKESLHILPDILRKVWGNSDLVSS